MSEQEKPATVEKTKIKVKKRRSAAELAAHYEREAARLRKAPMRAAAKQVKQAAVLLVKATKAYSGPHSEQLRALCANVSGFAKGMEEEAAG